MKNRLITLAFLVVCGVAEGAAITITKKTAIQVGPQSQLTSSNTARLLVRTTRDGGYFACTWAETNWTVQRYSNAGASVWPHALPIPDPLDALECRNGELLFLAGGGSTLWRLVRVSADGAYLGEVTLPREELRETQFDAVEETQDGFLLAGEAASGGRGRTTNGYAFVRRLSANLQTVWQRHYGNIGDSSPRRVLFLTLGSEGYLIGCDEVGVGIPIHRVQADGAIAWKRIWTGGPNAWDRFSTAAKCADGGFLLGAFSESPTGQAKTAEHFGGQDFWLVKVAADGSKMWDRSYGGTGGDQLTAILQTEDLGFLVSGTTFGSGVTGNKLTDGNGTWLLKLDSRGLKEVEMLFPTTTAWTPQLLTSPNGYRQTGSGWIADIVPLKKIRLQAKGTAVPFNLDVSSDLSHWTPLFINFSGDLSFDEPADARMKFFRATDAL